MSTARRILAVLECRPSDPHVLERAIEVASESGGYLTIVAVVPGPCPVFAGPYCVPQMTSEQRRAAAAAVLESSVERVPPGIPLITAIDEGKPSEVIARRVETAAHDLVVVRKQRRRSFPLWSRPSLAPVLWPAENP
jgi:nucleotide-binding universal stress UspA family protein